MVFGLVACGGGATTAAATEAAGSEAVATEAATEAAETQAAEAATGEGKTVGICIYKFDDNFMTVYREALQKMLEDKGYTVTVQDGNNDQATAVKCSPQ